MSALLNWITDARTDVQGKHTISTRNKLVGGGDVGVGT